MYIYIYIYVCIYIYIYICICIYIYITEIKSTCSIQLLVSCLTPSSGKHFYISIKQN